MVIQTLDPRPHLLLSLPFASPTPPQRPRRLYCPCRCGTGPSWDSNAEDVWSGKFKFRDRGAGGEYRRREKRKRWSDGPADKLDEEYEMDDDDDDDEPEDFWDKIWIFKVFKSYGYLLPAIIASMLLATGPMAFLMALALPLGQSAISLGFEKVWSRESEKPWPRYKAKKKPFGWSSNGFRGQEEEEDNAEINQRRQYYQSWVAAGGSVAEKAEPHTVGFGGWDELDRRGEFRRGFTGKKQPRTAPGSVPRAQPVQRGKLARRGRSKGTPLFLRLLIAVFPFLGSWTRLL